MDCLSLDRHEGPVCDDVWRSSCKLVSCLSINDFSFLFATLTWDFCFVCPRSLSEPWRSLSHVSSGLVLSSRFAETSSRPRGSPGLPSPDDFSLSRYLVFPDGTMPRS
ncbi:hypothetical protein CSUI_008849 [Cystoisospora suis]|uniref:Uncharacterized protein n=1 Tax=Cystoisospora suis TaxID=483139 RepID=A0A2C6KLL7_9APIC|nr:hypothetical protein CSUI_008849 [Cystoisospora suis]